MGGDYEKGKPVTGRSKRKGMQRTKLHLLIGVSVVIGLGMLLFLGLYFGLPSNKSTLEEPFHSKSGVYTTAAVAADAGRCSEIGVDMLRRGGHVVDAAIATQVCGGLFNPHSAGIGGGSFMSLYDAKSGKSVFINSRETAPLDADKNMFHGNGYLALTGSASIAVPGEVAGYWKAHQMFGKLPWKDLFEDSIKLAREGMIVSKALAKTINRERKYVTNSSFNLNDIYMNLDGTLKKEGDIVVRTKFAETLRAIADEGAYTFYNGTLADLIIADITEAVEVSRITKKDLQQYKVEVMPLLNITLGDYNIFFPGAPSSGPVLALILNILKGYKFNNESMKDTESKILTYHRIIEAFKFAFARRSELGDERFNENVESLIVNMTSPVYAEKLRLKISDDTTRKSSFYGGDFAMVPDHGTSHISLVGADGSAASATGTINTRFGSKVRGKRTGIIFNNEMDDFSSPNVTNYFDLPPSPNNFIQPGKRPMSSMVPTLVFQKSTGKIRMVAGASGGTKITTATAMAIMDVLWFGIPLQEAIPKKRIHHQLFPERIAYENGFDIDIISGLQSKHHQVKPFYTIGSVVQAILTSSNPDGMTAVCDPRKIGYPDGY